MFSLGFAGYVLGFTPDLQGHPYLLAIWDPMVDTDTGIKGRQFVLVDQPRLTLGRDPRCQIRLTNPYVSRFHAVLSRVRMGEREYYWIEDGDGNGKPSANGVLFAGKKITQAQQVFDGDQFNLGKQVSLTLHEIRLPTTIDYQQHEKLGDLLEEAGLISPEQLTAALHEQHHNRLLLGEVLLQKRWAHWRTVEFFMHHFIRSQAVTRKHLIGDYLLAAGLITKDQLAEAMRIHRRQQVYFGHALVQQGYLKPQVLQFFLDQAGIPTD
ncbi:MAG: FHA domain-containing protein [Thermostichales cyanobacterium SZTDM-1c_bins_54]